MFDEVLRSAALLLTAWLFGGMLLFAAGFAAFLFKALPMDQARALIRKAFPPFYLFVLAASSVAAALCAPLDQPSALALALIALTTAPARQWLMPAINAATARRNGSGAPAGAHSSVSAHTTGRSLPGAHCSITHPSRSTSHTGIPAR